MLALKYYNMFEPPLRSVCCSYAYAFALGTTQCTGLNRTQNAYIKYRSKFKYLNYRFPAEHMCFIGVNGVEGRKIDLFQLHLQPNPLT